MLFLLQGGTFLAVLSMVYVDYSEQRLNCNHANSDLASVAGQALISPRNLL